ARVLHDRPMQKPSALPFAIAPASRESLAYGAGATLLAFLLAAFGLYREKLPRQARAWGARVLEQPVAGLKALHSGVIGDYVMWITVGTALIGGIWAVTLR
ncbi:MAG: hypothetical protein QOF43_1415, partial [Gaiellaceae bacterium]|nr:hypothetical protein [Gaiellaceae bacterium]